MPTPLITSFVLGDYQTNCHVVTVPDAGDGNGECWIVDCGYEPGVLLDHVSAKGLQPSRILLTHAHSDHMAGVDEAMDRCGSLPLFLHRSEEGWCSDPALNLSAFAAHSVTSREPDHWLAGGETLELLGTTWRVVHAPGHSPGCVLYIHDASSQAIVGDTLFAGSIGRFDFPTSSHEDMRHTIMTTMMDLPDDLAIFPGHGPRSLIGTERETNPFILGGF